MSPYKSNEDLDQCFNLKIESINVPDRKSPKKKAAKGKKSI